MMSTPTNRITILLFAAYRELLGTNHIDLDLPEGTTVEDAFDALTLREPRLRDLRRFTTFAVNREVVGADRILVSSDEVALLQPVSGGSDIALLELRQEVLQPDRCLEAVRRAGSGGIVTFVGSVRDVSEGKQVEYLDYEAYEPMALDLMQQIIREAEERWPIRAVAIQHRLGRLQVGEDAVVIAVSCPHRAEAFESCRYLIDRLKDVVPIWKKERGEDGDEWVSGPALASGDPIPDREPD